MNEYQHVDFWAPVKRGQSVPLTVEMLRGGIDFLCRRGLYQIAGVDPDEFERRKRQQEILDRWEPQW